MKGSYPQFYKKYSSAKKVTMDTVLANVKADVLFGAVLCDIHVPEELYEEFSEFSPLFCTSTIPFDVIGPVMSKVWQDANTFPDGGVRRYPEKKALVGGMRCAKILLATPLLRFYLEKGLKVTRVYEVVEYSRMKCFRKFVDDITAARRLGDELDSQKILANMAKLTGNKNK